MAIEIDKKQQVEVRSPDEDLSGQSFPRSPRSEIDFADIRNLSEDKNQGPSPRDIEDAKLVSDLLTRIGKIQRYYSSTLNPEFNQAVADFEKSPGFDTTHAAMSIREAMEETLVTDADYKELMSGGDTAWLRGVISQDDDRN